MSGGAHHVRAAIIKTQYSKDGLMQNPAFSNTEPSGSWIPNTMLSVLFLLAAVCAFMVPVSVGPLSSEAYAQSCGGEGQKACFPTKCNGRLVLDFLKGVCIRKDNDIVNTVKDGAADIRTEVKQALQRPSTCGGRGQKPCKPPFFPSCNGRLVEHFLKNRCIQNDGDIVNMAKNTIKESGNLLGMALHSVQKCSLDKLLSSQRKIPETFLAQQMLSSRCLPIILEEARRAGYQTVTLGASGGGSFGIGFEGENGLAFDVNGRQSVATYHTLGVKFNAIGAGAAVTIGMYKKDNHSFGGNGHGATVAFAAAGGSGASAYFNYGSGQVEGVAAFITVGAEAELSYIRNRTEVLPTRIAGSAPTIIEEPENTWEPQEEEYGETEYYPPTDYAAPPPTTTQLAHNAANNIASALAAAIIARGEVRRAQKAHDAQRTMLKLCNRSKSKKIAIGFAYWKGAAIGGQAGWLSEGRFFAKRKKCAKIFLPDGPDGKGMDYSVKIWAFDPKSGKNWTGNSTPMCTDKGKAYTFRNADTIPCMGGSLRRFHSIPMEARRGENVYNFSD
ncbi:hypothetical protein [Parasphingorhabdus sp.]